MIFSKEDSAKTKGVAVILLVFHHLFFTDRGYEINLQLVSLDTLRTLAVAARICVWIFAFLSAYGIATQFARRPEGESISNFLKRRWVSLMKSYWFVFALTFLCMFLAGDNPMKQYNNSPVNLLLDGFAFSDFFRTPTLRTTWWYMCFAQMQLFVLPALILLCKKLGGLASIVLVFLGSQYMGSAITSLSGGNYLMYAMATLFGVLCVQYEFFEKIKPIKAYKEALRWISVLGVVILGIYLRFVVSAEDFQYKSYNIHWLSQSVSAVGVALLVFLLKGKLKKIQIGKAFAFLGTHSGNIFLVHMIYVKYLGKYIFITKNVILTTAILLGVSLLTSIGIEWLKKVLKYNQWFVLRENKKELEKEFTKRKGF